MSTLSAIGSAPSAWPDPNGSRAKARGADKTYASAAGTTSPAGTASAGTIAGLQGNSAVLSNQASVATAGSTTPMPTAGASVKGSQSPVPPPPSTVDFAQQRGNADSQADKQGGVSLNDLLNQIASDMDSSGDSSAAGIDASGSSSTDDADAAFDAIDTNGDGSISRSEFDAAFSSPDDPGDDDSTFTLEIDTSPTGSDLLDALENGGASPGTDPATAQFADLVGSLASALDNNHSGGLSAAQADAFKNQFDSAINAMASAGSANGSASPATSRQSTPEMATLADMVGKQYGQAAAQPMSNASFSTLA